jgi:hypothetical protein
MGKSGLVLDASPTWEFVYNRAPCAFVPKRAAEAVTARREIFSALIIYPKFKDIYINTLPGVL